MTSLGIVNWIFLGYTPACVVTDFNKGLDFEYAVTTGPQSFHPKHNMNHDRKITAVFMYKKSFIVASFITRKK